MICKYWIKTNKEAKLRDMIYMLQKRGSTDNILDNVLHERDSKKMAKMTKVYHDNLQSDKMDISEAVRESKIAETLSRVTAKPSEVQVLTLTKELLRDEVLGALKGLSSDSAPGLDGITYELLKYLNKCHEENTRLNRPAFDVAQLLMEVFNDIKQHGMDEKLKFAKGWMCPLYQKNNRDDIANYRPITCLNSDYKLFTKVLAA